MADEPSPVSAFSGALTKLASELYGDIGSPAAKHVGSALETVFKVGLSPIKLLDWGYEQTKDWLAEKVSSRLASTPAEHRIAPSYAVVVSAISGVAATHDAPEMRELFAELLLKAMDARTAKMVHPAYLTLLSQLSAPEALVLMSLKRVADRNLQHRQGDSVFMERRGSHVGDSTDTLEMQFAAHCASIGFDESTTAQVWLDNLERLALLKVDRHSDLNLVAAERERVKASLQHAEYRYLYVTGFGEGFLAACTPAGASNAP